MADEFRIPREVADRLRYYVYALRDPRTRKIFYVGKGIGDRINAHVREASADPQAERAKLRTINDIEASGQPVDLLFLRTGISDEREAFVVEQAVIDAFHADHRSLTNLVRGHHSGSEGLASLPSVIARYRADPCPSVSAPVIMLKIQKGWRSDMNELEIYNKTRGHWKVGPDTRRRAEYALGIAYDIVRGAYRIEPGSWFPSQVPQDAGQGRWGFEGSPALELEATLGTHVRDAFPNQVMYRKFLDGYEAPDTQVVIQR